MKKNEEVVFEDPHSTGKEDRYAVKKDFKSYGSIGRRPGKERRKKEKFSLKTYQSDD
jgi:hypothetical protein